MQLADRVLHRTLSWYCFPDTAGQTDLNTGSSDELWTDVLLHNDQVRWSTVHQEYLSNYLATSMLNYVSDHKAHWFETKTPLELVQFLSDIFASKSLELKRVWSIWEDALIKVLLRKLSWLRSQWLDTLKFNSFRHPGKGSCYRLGQSNSCIFSSYCNTSQTWTFCWMVQLHDRTCMWYQSLMSDTHSELMWRPLAMRPMIYLESDKFMNVRLLNQMPIFWGLTYLKRPSMKVRHRRKLSEDQNGS